MISEKQISRYMAFTFLITIYTSQSSFILNKYLKHVKVYSTIRKHLTLMFLTMLLIYALIIGKLFIAPLLNMYSMAKLSPFFDTLNDIKQNSDVNVILSNPTFLDNFTHNISDVTYLQNRAHKYSNMVPIAHNYEEIQHTITQLIRGQAVMVVHSTFRSLLLYSVLDELEVGKHIHVSDHRYYPTFSYNYVSKDHKYHRNICIM